MPEDIEQIRIDEYRRIIRVVRICAGLCLAAFVLSLILTSCTSPDRQWRESQRVLEITQHG